MDYSKNVFGQVDLENIKINPYLTSLTKIQFQWIGAGWVQGEVPDEITGRKTGGWGGD